MTTTATNLPLAVLPYREVTGWGSPADDKEVSKFAKLLGFGEAMQKEFHTDAHFVPYLVFDDKSNVQSKMPRLKKGAAAFAREKGNEVLCHTIGLDWDTPGHVPWTPENYKLFEQRLVEAEAKSELINKGWAAWYMTDCGCRWVYRLETAVSVEETEQIMRGLVDHFHEHGLQVDDLKDWTRLMRMPKVNRDGKRTWQSKHHSLMLFADRFCDPKDLPHDETHNTKVVRINSIPAEMPDPLASKDAMWSKGSRSAFFQAARRALKGSPAYEVAIEGKRSPTGNIEIFSLAGKLVRLVYPLAGATIQKAFGLLIESVEQMPVANGYSGESWEETLWRAVVHAWEGEEAQARDRAEEVKIQVEKQGDIWDGIIEGVKEWCASFDVHRSFDEAKDFLERRLILIHKTVFYLLQPNGYYSEPITRTELVPLIRHSNMSEIIDLWRENKHTKGMRPANIDEILRRHSAQTLGVRAAFGSKKGSTVEGMHRPQIKNLVRTMYSLRDLKGEYHHEVAMWLSMLCADNEEDHKALLGWIGHSLDFSRGIPMLSLVGDPAIGKQLLVRGLAENLDTPVVSNFSSVVGDYQEGLLYSPFIVANEGFPHEPRNGLRIADQVRGLISGDPQDVNVKFMPIMRIENFYRVIMTANNTGGLIGLYKNYDLERADRDAIRERLVLIRGNNAAAVYLKKLGGMDYTAKDGARWVSSPGAESDYIVAKHFRWLYENREHAEHGSRLLVPGYCDKAVLNDMAVNSGDAPTVVRCVFDCLLEEGLDGVEVDDNGNPLITTKAVLDMWMNQNYPGQTNLQKVGRALSGMSTGQPVRKRGGKQRYRFFLLDMDLLVQQAYRYGITIPDRYLSDEDTDSHHDSD